MDKLHRLNNGFTSVSHYSHTGEGMEDRLTEHDSIVVENAEEFLTCVDHVLERIRQTQDSDHALEVSRLDIESLKEKVLSNYPAYSDHVISFEYLKDFETSPTYGIIIRNRHTGEALSKIHVALTAP